MIGFSYFFIAKSCLCNKFSNFITKSMHKQAKFTLKSYKLNLIDEYLPTGGYLKTHKDAY